MTEPVKRGYTKQEAKRRRAKFMVLEGMWDFVSIIAAFFVVLACVVLLTTLISWFRGDIVQVVDSLEAPIVSAFETTDQAGE